MKSSQFFLSTVVVGLISFGAFANGKKECVGSDGQPMAGVTSAKACKKAHGTMKKVKKESKHEMKEGMDKSQ